MGNVGLCGGDRAGANARLGDLRPGDRQPVMQSPDLAAEEALQPGDQSAGGLLAIPTLSELDPEVVAELNLNDSDAAWLCEPELSRVEISDAEREAVAELKWRKELEEQPDEESRATLWHGRMAKLRRLVRVKMRLEEAARKRKKEEGGGEDSEDSDEDAVERSATVVNLAELDDDDDDDDDFDLDTTTDDDDLEDDVAEGEGGEGEDGGNGQDEKDPDWAANVRRKMVGAFKLVRQATGILGNMRELNEERKQREEKERKEKEAKEARRKKRQARKRAKLERKRKEEEELMDAGVVEKRTYKMVHTGEESGDFIRGVIDRIEVNRENREEPFHVVVHADQETLERFADEEEARELQRSRSRQNNGDAAAEPGNGDDDPLAADEPGAEAIVGDESLFEHKMEEQKARDDGHLFGNKTMDGQLQVLAQDRFRNKISTDQLTADSQEVHARAQASESLNELAPHAPPLSYGAVVLLPTPDSPIPKWVV